MSELPDTPPWSPGRVRAVAALFAAGAAMVAAGCMPAMPESRAILLVGNGTDMMVSTVLGYAGLASFERAAGWWRRPRQDGAA